MGFVGESMESIKSIKFRDGISQVVSLGRIVTLALLLWKALILITGSESPVVVVLSGSMEPGFQRGDILFLHMSKDPIRAGEIIVFKVDERSIPIVHRVIEVHEPQDITKADILTKGDSNDEDDRVLYAEGQVWLKPHDVMGRAVGFLPYVGWMTIIMTEKPVIKVASCSCSRTYVLLSAVYTYWRSGFAGLDLKGLGEQVPDMVDDT
ncbi:hypothetical protein Tsubulata_023449 [Turnera subulata]|uniref:Signal peptidase complex catalytic subunit SEC11 n=1 Tax=Turnera subulata TaxID=218843 RepID=A0A9Q0G6S2_9ROSI|nr:hypothetical protein Tsubulata_023449 [Turnera subulata]